MWDVIVIHFDYYFEIIWNHKGSKKNKWNLYNNKKKRIFGTFIHYTQPKVYFLIKRSYPSFKEIWSFYHSLAISVKININYIFYKQYHFKNSLAIANHLL